MGSGAGRAYLEWAEQIGVRLAPNNLIADSRAIADYFDSTYGIKPTYLTMVPTSFVLPDPIS